MIKEDKKGCGCKKKVEMSVPEGHVFNNPYTLNATHDASYYDFNRNKGNTPGFEERVLEITKQITDLLIKKNKAYGDTALNPTNIFSKLNSTEAICARIDDKLARIKNKGITDETEDTVDDLIGYLILLKMSL